MKIYCIAIYAIMMTACASSPVEPTGDDSEPAGEPATETATSSVTNACANSCVNASNQCFATCDRFPNPNCEPRCEQRFTNCMNACGCPFSEEFDRTVFDHAESTNNTLCVGPAFSSGFVYRRFNTFNRNEHVRDTLQCDGLTVRTILSSTVVSAGPCYSKLFPAVSCPMSQFPANALCVF